MSRRLLVLAGALSGALLLSACGSADTATQPTRTIPGSATSTTLATTTTTPNYACDPTTPVVPPEGKPEVTIPEGAAPTQLETKDIKVGTGAEAKVGDKVAMQYVGKAKSNGKEFDASWTRNAEPFTFTIASPDPSVQGQVIKGWDQGVAGMKVGGRRLLVIPPALGYGDQAKGADIAANDTLYFVVDLVQVCTPVAATPGSGVPGSSTTVAGAPTGSSTTVIPSSTTTAPASSTTATTASTGTTAAK